MTTYNFCSNCGHSIDTGSEPAYCSNCDTTFYRNAKPCASVLIVRGDEVLIAIRGRNPFKGAYDIVGGFINPDELPEDAAIREAKEETGLDIKITSLLGTYIDRYGEEGDYTLNLHYIGEIVGGEMKAMDDVAELKWVKITDVPTDSGFQNTRDGLRDLKKQYSGA